MASISDIFAGAFPSLVNTGINVWGQNQTTNGLTSAANQTRTEPVNMSTGIGTTQYTPGSRQFNINGNAPGAFGGASSELVGALGGINNTDGEYQGRLGLLEQQAQPGEQRQVNSTLDSLFSKGQLGGTGGAIQQEALGNSLQDARLKRQMTAADWARTRQLDRFQSAMQTVGSGQAQQQLDTQRTSALGSISAGAVGVPNAQLLAGAVGSNADRNNALVQGLGPLLSGILQGGPGQAGAIESLRNLLGGGGPGAGAGLGGVNPAGAAGLPGADALRSSILAGTPAPSSVAGALAGAAPAAGAGLAALTNAQVLAMGPSAAAMNASIMAGSVPSASTTAALSAPAASGGLGTLGTIGAGLGVAAGAAGAYEGIRTGNEGMAALGAGVGAASAGALAGLSGLAALGPIGLAAAGVAAIGASLVNTKEFGDKALSNYWAGIDSGRQIGQSDPVELAQGFINFYRTNKNEFPGQATYGRTGNEDFMYDLTQKINAGVASGAVPAGATPEQIVTSVVQPWLDSMGPGPQDRQARAVQDFMMTDIVNSFMNGQPISNAQVKGDQNFRIVSGRPVYAGQAPATLAPPVDPNAPDWASLGIDPNNPFAGLGM